MSGADPIEGAERGTHDLTLTGIVRGTVTSSIRSRMLPMADLHSLNAADVIALCQASTAEASACLARVFDAKLSLSVGEAGTLAAGSLAGELTGPGLLLIFCLQDTAVVAVLPGASGLLPAWCASPNSEESQRLRTLAQELSGVLLPQAYEPTEVAAAYVESLADALERASLPDDATLVSITLTRDDGASSTLRMIWPVTRVETVYGALDLHRETKLVPEASRKLDHGEDGDTPAPRHHDAATVTSSKTASLEDLPPYARSLLRIEVPVMVNLATKRQPVARILELGVGAIIQFEKSCDELLDLYVGNQRIAQGEAVKVGEKFGIRVTSIALPEERFERVRTK